MFGAPKTSFAFGNTQPSSSGLFGSTATTTTASGFGGFGAKPFGATTNTGFGAGTSGGGLFGGTTAQPASGGLFGATTTPQQATGGGLFGANNNAGSSFLKPATSTTGFTGFGAASTGGGLFGTTTQPTQSTGGLFGSTTSTAATGTGLFGASTSGFGAAGQPTGTAGTKFAAVDGTDNMVRSGVTTQVKTKHYCITGMKQYEGKSLEELRLDDYTAGLKGPKAGGTATGTGLFGSSISQPAASSTGFGGFGAAATSATPAFGGFGTTTTQAATGFGAKPAGGLFGGTSTSTGGLFGQTATAAPAFGGAAPAGGGLFGSTATSKPNPFGASTGFGTGTAFGQASTASTGFGGFGAKTAAPAFGAATSANTGFGGFGTQTTTAGFGGFGAKPTLTFGAQPAASGTGVFGAAATGFGVKQATGFGFGTGTLTGLGQATAQPQQPLQLTSNTNQQAQQDVVQQYLLNLANSPYGDSPLFRNIKKERKSIVPTDPATQKSVLAGSDSKLKVNPRPISKVKLTNSPSVQAIGTTFKSDLFEGLEDDAYTPEKYASRRNVKKLVIRPSTAASGASSRVTTAGQQQSAFSSPSIYGALARPDAVHSTLDVEESFDLSATKVERRPVSKLYPSLELNDTINELQAGSNRPKPSPVDSKPVINTTYVSNGAPPAGFQQEDTTPNPPRSTARLSVSKLESVDIQEGDDGTTGQSSPSPHPCGVVCTRADYYTLPPLDELGDYLDANGDCFVENLSIGREGYGSVYFPGTTNVANLDIDSTVHFRRKEITVYPDDDNKPPEGQALNKRAEVTLDYVWPNDKTTHSPIKSPERLKVMNYQDKIEMATARIGAKFIDYRPDTGSWVFEVKHFSKYGLLDDDSDEDNANPQATPKEVSKLKTLNLQSLNVQKQPMKEQLSGGAPFTQEAGVKQRLLPPIGTNNLGDSDEERENRKPDNMLELTRLHGRNVIDQEVDEADMSLTRPLSMSYQLAAQCGVGSTNIQRMKASFLDDDEDDLNVSLLARGDKGSPAGMSMLKQRPMSDSFSILPQSPLIRSGLKSGSPAPRKHESSFYGTPTKPELGMDYKEEKPLSLLKLHKRSTKVQLPEPDYPLLPSGVERPLQPKSRIQGHRLLYKQLPLAKSLLDGQQRSCMLDAACTAGRRSRAGWTKNLVIAHVGSSSLLAKEDRHSSGIGSKFSILSPGRTRFVSPYQVTLETANFGAQSNQLDPLVLETRLKSLRIQLKHLTHTGTAACPKLEPAPGIASLHEYGKESLNDLDTASAHRSDSSVQSMLRHHVLVWELAVALWGSLPEFEQMDDIDRESYLYQSARNEAFSRWLSYAASHQVELLTKQPPKQFGDAPNSIFAHLTARQVPEATKLAVSCRDLRLALLVSQAGSSQTTKNMVHKQLLDWTQTGADKFISPDRLRTYALLAGCMVWESSTGLVNCCVDLDWKRALALHFWYCQSKLSIPSALARYDAAWQGSSACESYAAPPLPPYLEESGEDDCQSRDTCYHLLQLYCKGSYRLDQLLLTASSTSDPMDYHMSWHLMQVLSSLGYTHLDDWQKAALHTRYSEQLESCGLWEWAIIPLLHLPSSYQREKCVKELLLRHIRLDVAEGSDNDSMAMSDDEDSERCEYAKKEKFLLTELNIPARWISETKAIKARCEGLVEEEAWHLLQCQQFNSAHKLILAKLAPEYIVRDDLDGLHSYLDQLHRGAHSVSGWKVGGKIYLDYITTHDVVDDILQQQPGSADGYSLEKLRPELLSLAHRLLSMDSPTPLHMLAKTTMALHIARNIKFVRSLEKEALVPNTQVVSSRCLVESFSVLPLQSDDAIVLLKETLSSFMLEY